MDGRPDREWTDAFIDFAAAANVKSRDSHVSDVTFIGRRFHGVSVGVKLVGLYDDNIPFDDIVK